MAAGRIQIASNRKSALLQQSKREIAILLSEGKEDTAKVRAEVLIRDENLIEAYEILQGQCELLYERIKLIEQSKSCPSDLIPVASTLIWASCRVDIPELMDIRKQLKKKYGKFFETCALENRGNALDDRVVMKLAITPPEMYLVYARLQNIAEQFQVDWSSIISLSVEEGIMISTTDTNKHSGQETYGMVNSMINSCNSPQLDNSTISTQTSYISAISTPPNSYRLDQSERLPMSYTPSIITATHVTPIAPRRVVSDSGTFSGGADAFGGACSTSRSAGEVGRPPRSGSGSPNIDDFSEFDIFVPAPCMKVSGNKD